MDAAQESTKSRSGFGETEGWVGRDSDSLATIYLKTSRKLRTEGMWQTRGSHRKGINRNKELPEKDAQEIMQ